MKPNKLKRNLIIIFSIIILLLIVILVLYITTDIFRTKRGAFFRYFAQIPEAIDILETTDEYKEYIKTKKTNSYIRNGEMIITESNNIANQNILNNVKLILNGKYNVNDEINNINIDINSNNNQLANIKLIKDKLYYGLYSNDINDKYICVKNENLNTLAKNIGIENYEYIPNQIDEMDFEDILSISNLEKKHIEEYIQMIKNQSPDTAYIKETNKKIEIQGKKYETNSYTLKLNSNQNKDLQISVLEKLSTDSIIMNFITSKCKLLNLNEEYTDINILNNSIKDKIQKLKNDNNIGEFSITVYEYKQKNIQTQIKVDDLSIIVSNISENEEKLVILEIENANNNYEIKIKQSEGKKYITIKEESNDIIKSVEFIYYMTGTIKENNIENYLTIKINDDIKSISYEYKDKVSFTKDVGLLESLENKEKIILNDYDINNIKNLINDLKKQINNAYINKAASIGINLDPIFEI